MPHSRFSFLDVLLLLMALIWAANYSIIKAALREIPPVGFNALRLLMASALFLSTIGALRASGAARNRLSAHDWRIVMALGFVGQFVYQVLFMHGLERTSVANSALILGSTPVFIALIVAALGHERVSPTRWLGTLLSVAGIYIIVGGGAAIGGATVGGDVTMLAATFCWSVTSVAARGILTRHSAVVVTGYSMAIGSLLYLPFAWLDLHRIAWREVSAFSWAALCLSAAFALFLAYIIWYTAVQHLGSARTSVYSNLVPVAAMVVAYVWLGEPIGPRKIAGAVAILSGVALARVPGV